jgi:hypothetical protein
MTIAKPPTLLHRGGLIFGLVAAAVVLVQWTLHLASLDPFAGFRNPEAGPLGGLVGIRMDNTRLKFYSGATPVGVCSVARIDIQKNRQFLDLYFVKNGSYKGPNGTFEYRADRAQWDANRQRMLVMSGAEIKNPDMRLVTDGFEYSQASGRLFVKDLVRGELFGGKVQAARLTYSLLDGSYHTGPIEWTGLAALSPQDTGGAAPKKTNWNIKAASISRDKQGVTEIFETATATDGEVIVKADHIERTVKTDVLTATGKVLYFGEKANLTCDKAVVYRKEKRAILTGNVQMILKPKEQQKLEVVEIAPFHPQVPEDIAKDRPPAPPEQTAADKKLDDEVRSGKATRKYPIIIHADRIEYWYAKGSRHAVIDGSPQARQDMAAGRWRYVWTHQALYDGEKETIRLVSRPGEKDAKVKTSIGDDFIAEWFEFSTEEDNEWFEGNKIEGTFVSGDEEVPKIGGDGKKADDKKGDGKKVDDKKGDGKPPIKGPIGAG